MSSPFDQLAAARLPELREDLRLFESAPRADGAPSWVVYDPLQHRYHELEENGRAMLALWRGETTFAHAAERLSARCGRPVDVQEVMEIVASFDRLGLLCEPMKGWPQLDRQAKAARKGALEWLMHNYLFMRWPLARPQVFLEATLPFARRLCGRVALAVYAVIALAGLYLASRQWDEFQGSLAQFMSIEGAAGYLVALIGVKILHELGHGYAAVAYGCRVPTMGVALMVMTPVLYTDVTDAWRLRSHRERLAIDAAGVLVELAVAGLATALWAISPEGVVKSAAFFVATVSWAMSLAVNLNPFMRYDAYYMLSDACATPNLQPRAFALMRWRLRETLFALGEPCPEDWPPVRRALIAAYGAATAVYRLALFLGVAALVYVYAFKVLGVVLFLVEIIWFVARPIWGEARVWWSLRRKIARSGRSYASGAAMLSALVAALAPWSRGVEIEAILEPVRSERLTAVMPARVEAVLARDGESVRAGQTLLKLESPQLERDLVLAKIKLELNETRRSRRASDAQDREATLTLESEAASLREKIAGLERLRAQLEVRAENDGLLVDVPKEMSAGRWVGRGEDLGLVIAPDAAQARGYASENVALRLKPGAVGRFIPDDLTAPSRPVRLADVSTAAAAAIEIPYLTSTHGGRLAVNEDRERGATPVETQYLAVMRLEEPSGRLSQVQRGVVRLEGEAESFAARAARKALSTLVRESGF